jgi:hypothetical protein
MISERSASSAAWTESARRIGIGWAASASMPGIQPTVEIAVRRLRDAQVGQALAGREHVVEVHHRLAHAHEDGVVDVVEAPEVQGLVEDLARGQVAPELHLPGGAEAAGQRAARLRREAQRAPVVAVAHEDGLTGPPVVCAEERLDRAVARVGPRPRASVRRNGTSSASRARRATGRSVMAS